MKSINTIKTVIVSFLLMAVTQTALAEQTIRITNGEWQPFMSEHVPHNGMVSHIITEAFALVGIDVEYGFFPWKRAYDLAKKGSWDGSAAWRDAEERRANFLYSEPVTETTWAYFHLKSSPFDWTTIDDLKSLKIGATLQYDYGAEFDKAEAEGRIKTERVASDELSLKKLLKGRIDIFVGEPLVTYAQIRDNFSEEEAAMFTHNPQTFDPNSLHLVFSRQVETSEQMRDKFNEGLQKLKETGRYDEIIADGLAGKYVRSN